MRREILAFFFIFIFILAILPFNVLAETEVLSKGWEERGAFYKPFVSLRDPTNKLVIFISSNARVYRGSCRKREAPCKVYPGKRFRLKVPIRFIVLDLEPLVPEFVETGVIK